LYQKPGGSFRKSGVDRQKPGSGSELSSGGDHGRQLADSNRQLKGPLKNQKKNEREEENKEESNKEDEDNEMKKGRDAKDSEEVEEGMEPRWYDGNHFTCQICGFSWQVWDKVRQHHENVHNIRPGNFGKVSDRTDNFYECQLCQKEVYHERDMIRAHLTSDHHCSVEIYEKWFESSEPLSQDPAKVIEALLNTDDPDPGIPVISVDDSDSESESDIEVTCAMVITKEERMKEKKIYALKKKWEDVRKLAEELHDDPEQAREGGETYDKDFIGAIEEQWVIRNLIRKN
jgi:hypothetical protein